MNNINAAIAIGCLFATAPLRAVDDFGTVEKWVQARSGAAVLWETDQAQRAKAEAIVNRLLKEPLTVSSAVQIGLLNNRDLQASFEEAGVARADLITAVTVPNPSVDFEVTFPNTAPFGQKYAWVVAQDFVQMLMIPLKKKVAADKLAVAESRVADETLKLVEKVKAAWFTAAAGQQFEDRLKEIQQTNKAALEFSQQQFQAGNGTDLALLQSQSAYDEGRLDVVRAATAQEGYCEELNRLLGLWGKQTSWHIRSEIPPLPDSDPNVRGLESLAVAQRPDLRAAREEVSALVSALGLTKTFRWVGTLQFGFAGEQDPTTPDLGPSLLTGPAFRFELPIFNQGQDRIALGEAELRQAEDHFEALAVDVRSETHELREKLTSLRETGRFYHDEILPVRKRIVGKLLSQYNAMQVSSDQLFAARAGEISAEQDYVNTLRDYWITRASLERAVGGRLAPLPEGNTLTRK